MNGNRVPDYFGHERFQLMVNNKSCSEIFDEQKFTADRSVRVPVVE
jgi:hypothetical protein